MLTKELFKKHLQRLVEYKEAQDKIENVMRGSVLKDDFSGSLYGLNMYEDLAFNILKDAMGDIHDYIGYWLYELNAGKDYRPGCLKAINGKCIKLKTIDNLYQLIQKSM